MENKSKEKVVNSLGDELEIRNIKKFFKGGSVGITFHFLYHGKFGSCSYALYGVEEGITECIFDEREGEDIYGIIHNFIDEHIQDNVIVKYDGKEVKMSDEQKETKEDSEEEDDE